MFKAPHFPRRKKLQLFKTLLLLGCEIWGYAASTQIQKVQITQNIFIRAISETGWYTIIISRNKDLYESLSGHDNPLINEYLYDPLEPRKYKQTRLS
ncbi:hypothetical protein PR048_025836 [Dryococelus australis]|uniref:Uncharacterized protein n=1 Tax=Dryococelus australis TaxID=614101 RepID=A0ABQ9GJN8_9NEOP|nr:hypothetical protein PR048_025836 [Dryococelus australis]